MVVACIALITLFSVGSASLMRQDPATRKRAGFLRHWRRLGARDTLPTPASIGRAVLRYYEPGFHPRTEGDLSVALSYLERSPAAQRAAAEAGA